jgi:putative Mg2+ transporter-C (MgtC) family protein
VLLLSRPVSFTRSRLRGSETYSIFWQLQTRLRDGRFIGISICLYAVKPAARASVDCFSPLLRAEEQPFPVFSRSGAGNSSVERRPLDLLPIQFDTNTSLDVIALRMGLAALLGGLIGLNREWREKPAGLKTHILVAVGASSFALLSLEMYMDAIKADEMAQADPIRVIEAMIKGVAFLGAGAIIQSRGSVAGITTGASIWTVGAIGLACGGGYFSIAVLASIFAFATLTVVQGLERILNRKRHRNDER